ncbi:cadherin-4-like isoform X1, partial [Tachysurus ichikawai]
MFPVQFSGEVMENSVNVVLANLSVIDKDEPRTPNWNAVYRIVSGDNGRHFTIRTNPENNDGMLTVVKFSGEVMENSVNVVLANLSVIDKDEPRTPNWNAVYRIVSGDNGRHFTIRTNPENNDGMLTVVK